MLISDSDPSNAPKLPKGLDDDDPTAVFSNKRVRGRTSKRDKKSFKDKDWVLKKKELNRKRGKATPLDSQYTARKRKPRF